MINSKEKKVLSKYNVQIIAKLVLKDYGEQIISITNHQFAKLVYLKEPSLIWEDLCWFKLVKIYNISLVVMEVWEWHLLLLVSKKYNNLLLLFLNKVKKKLLIILVLLSRIMKATSLLLHLHQLQPMKMDKTKQYCSDLLLPMRQENKRSYNNMVFVQM